MGKNTNILNSLKFKLVMQSLSPLAFLIVIRNFTFVMYDVDGNKLTIVQFVFSNIVLLFVMAVCVLWLLYSCYAYFSFSVFKYSNKTDGYEIEIDEEKEEASLNFFSTLIIPLLLNDVAKIQGTLTFICIVVMLIILLYRTSLFYANPVLAILGYHVYDFHFHDNTDLQGQYIGLSKGRITGKQTIEYKKITEKVIYIKERNR